MTAMTDVGFVRMRISKVAGVRDGDRVHEFVVLDEPGGDRHLLIKIGQAEAFALVANLDEMEWGRPMTYQFMAQLVRSLGGRIREVRLDGLVAGAYAATVEVEGPQGVELVDRPVERRPEPRGADRRADPGRARGSGGQRPAPGGRLGRGGPDAAGAGRLPDDDRQAGPVGHANGHCRERPLAGAGQI